jgi:hypothetical protein
MFGGFFIDVFSGKKDYTCGNTTAAAGSNTAGVVGVGGC